MKVESALRLAGQGFRVFPLSPNSKIPPKGLPWKEVATTDTNQVEEWWLENPDYNIGVATGNGLLVVDADVKKGGKGDKSLEDLLGPMQLFEKNEFVWHTVVTPTNGRHVYVTVDGKHQNRAKTLPNLPDLDIRGENGYVVGPGSSLDGKPYKIGTWHDEHKPRKAAQWFEDFLHKTSPERTAHTDTPVTELDQPANIAKATQYLAHHAPNAVEGAGGNDATFRTAARLRDFALSERTALELLAEHWNETKASPPWPIDELAVLTHNAFSYASSTWGAMTAAADFEPDTTINVGQSPIHAVGVSDAIETVKPASNNPFHFLTYDEMQNLSEPEWLIDGLLQKRAATLLFGKSNSFKSFLAIDIGCSVATGTPWHNMPTKQGKVLYVATEGANGVGRLRIPGWFDNHNTPHHLRNNMYLFPKEIRLDTKDDVLGLIKAIKQIGNFELVIFDIFGGTMSGSEIEDTTARAWVHNTQLVMRECNVATFTVAHTGWQDQTRARMHTHFWGSFDSRLRADGDKDKLQTIMAVERHKDADSMGVWGFSMAKVGLTLVPTLDDNVTAEGKSQVASLPEAEKKAMAALDQALTDRGELRFGEQWPKCRVVSAEHWRLACDALKIATTDTSDAKRKAFYRVQKSLVKRGLVDEEEKFFWPRFDA